MTPDEFTSARRRLGLTQVELGEILGLSRRAVQNIEAGETQRIKPLVEREIARLLAAQKQ
ncbi:helix-turn-helix transcriptional regulator [Paenirhodobacter sp. CAU 1674]|uniref:helix-turn-helix domain-containing protein n=1 Tax=Paenirhodobacter sp. CAU 1674 TaxID=3032596 RepID=UPI0023DB442C|nr:helix-turn-helix transcriptional regulator [Paenirhodobacter sp. CAU 1674]MDF2143219.1 helix-turn-helix transcriptional regulator [Paenirhodobacter sp. CAU 1674]